MASIAVRWATWLLAGSNIVPASPLSPITFPTVAAVGRVEIAIGADPAADPATWSWADITAYVRYADGITITKGRPDETGTVDAAKATMRLDNTDGRFSRLNPSSPYYGLLSRNTPIRVGVDPGDGVHYRFHGFINEWPTRWDLSGNTATAPITAAGILRRLSRGRELPSPHTGAILGSATTPLAYWPLEDPERATSAASMIPGVDAMHVRNEVRSSLPGGGGDITPGGLPIFAANPGPPGSGALASLQGMGNLVGKLPTGLTNTSWTVEWVMTLPNGKTAGEGGTQLMWTAAGTYTHFTLESLSDGTLTVSHYTDAGYETLTASGVTDGLTVSAYDGAPHHYSYTVAQNGGDYRIKLYVDGTLAHSAVGTIAGTVGAPTGVEVNPWDNFNRNTNGATAIGQLVVWPTEGAPIDTVAAAYGFPGEQAHVRMARLCTENNVSFFTVAGTSVRLDRQRPGTLLQSLRDSESADGGVLYENEFGLGYQSLDERLNAPVAFALDFNAGHIAAAPEPTDDDQHLHNFWEARGIDGGREAAQDDASIAANGLYDASVTVNVTPGSLADQAGWRLHRDVADEYRWPSISLRFNATPALIPAWTSLPYGSRITVANPPAQMPPDALDLVVEGWSEKINPLQWEATLNTSPASVYNVGSLADTTGDTSPVLGWLSADTCTLDASVSTTSATWLVDSSPLWTTAGDDFPCDIRVEGEVVRVTAVSAGPSPQTWTVIRSINGVVKAHPAGVAVELVHPVVLTP
jgi:hypothetical protein